MLPLKHTAPERAWQQNKTFLDEILKTIQVHTVRERLSRAGRTRDYAGTTSSSKLRNSCTMGSELRSISATLPKKIDFPAFKNTTRSASFFASRMSCVTTMLVK